MIGEDRAPASRRSLALLQGRQRAPRAPRVPVVRHNPSATFRPRPRRASGRFGLASGPRTATERLSPSRVGLADRGRHALPAAGERTPESAGAGCPRCLRPRTAVRLPAACTAPGGRPRGAARRPSPSAAAPGSGRPACPCPARGGSGRRGDRRCRSGRAAPGGAGRR